LIRARRRALGAAADGPPRFLVRVDEYPDYSAYDEPSHYGSEASRAFYEVLAEAGVHHLLALVPQLTHHPLDPAASGGRAWGDAERALLERMRAEGLVSFAQHGRTHRTRFRSPRQRSELVGLSRMQLLELLDGGAATLAAAGIHTRVLVPPFNRFAADQWTALAERYDVVTGGPESTTLMGFHGGPLWRGDAVYLPCYAPLYADARTILPAAERMIALAPGTWVPIVLHMGWEADDGFRQLRELARLIGPYTASWEDFLAAVDRSATPASPRRVAAPLATQAA
jgi:hypothetical protein